MHHRPDVCRNVKQDGVGSIAALRPHLEERKKEHRSTLEIGRRRKYTGIGEPRVRSSLSSYRRISGEQLQYSKRIPKMLK
eukprot:5310490-Pyramimonas_sp.AAC.1